MKLAIHNSQTGFHPRWVTYCKNQGIPFKHVNCYANDLISQLNDCSGLMWHFSQNNPKDIVIAKQILFALEHTGFKVFPDFRTAWHFDDKVGQKYLLERVGAPLVPSYAFYDLNSALEWVEKTDFPKVFKLRGGAGSANVRLVHTRAQAKKLARQSFGRGHTNYDVWGHLKERWYKYRLGKASLIEPLKGIVRLFKPPPYAKALGREVGYAYFQNFIPNNDSDTRIIVLDNKAFALKRYVRKGDFRASGSGVFAYARELFDERCVQIAFDLSERLQLQSAAYDFVFNVQQKPLVVEVSYGFITEVYDPCPGYWDKNLQWNEGKFDHAGWMVKTMVRIIAQK